MSRIFGDRSQVERWFAQNHPLSETTLTGALTEAEENPGPEWIGMTRRFRVRVYRGVWEIEGIRLGKGGR